MDADDASPDALAACQACTPADGIMVGCAVEGPHERHRGTYVREFAGAGMEVEVSWLEGEPAERDLSVPVDEYPAFRAPTIAAAGSASVDDGRDPPAAHGQARPRMEALSPDDREALGRIVREVWVACAREHPNPKPSWLVPWEELGEWDQETDRRIGASLATHGAAIAAVRMHELHIREIEAAGEKLAAGDALIRQILEAACRRDGLPLESSVAPGEPARNYELTMRLGIGHIFGIGSEGGSGG